MPSGTLPSGSRFGVRAVAGSTHSRPVWIEERPPGPLLSDITDHIDPRLFDHIVLQICHAVELLHLAHQTHGSLSMDNIAVDARGRVTLLGSGRCIGSPHGDVEAIKEIYRKGRGASDLPDHLGLDEIITGLTESVPPALDQLGDRLDAYMIDTQGAPVLEVILSTAIPLAPLDEVGFDLGPDERGSGVLDEWTSGTDEGSAERTGTLSQDAVSEQRCLALLSRLGLTPGDQTVPEHILALNGSPIDAIASLALDENLDPLPSPGSLDSPLAQPAGDTSAGEVTRARTGPLLPGFELEDVTAARLESTESFSSPSEITRIQRRPSPPGAPRPLRPPPLLWLTLLGWALALLAIFWVWMSGGLSL
jgi:hypothetical protein